LSVSTWAMRFFVQNNIMINPKIEQAIFFTVDSPINFDILIPSFGAMESVEILIPNRYILFD